MKRNDSGQVLVLVLLVVLIGLTAGLSIASRTLKNIRNSGDLDTSNRAFSAAEAGIERVLQSGSTCTVGTCISESALVTGAKVTVKAESLASGDSGFATPSLAQDDVFQVSLSGLTMPASGPMQFDVCWGDSDDMEGTSYNNMAVVVSVVYESGGNYGMKKLAFDYKQNRNNGFDKSMNTYETCSSPQLGDRDFGLQKRVNLAAAPAVPPLANLKFIRIRALYNGGKAVAVVPVGAWDLPTQGTVYTSTAVVGDTHRTVRVFKSFPQMPALFDYALFNGSTNTLQK